jgi:tetratricopeptide (TPR) repeat protein
MAINFKCPNAKCSKPFVVKDELAGKRSKCPACGKPLTIPLKTTAASTEAHLEELAAAALIDAPVAEGPAKPAQTVDFTCPQCEEPIQLPAELQGKQTPCPKCRRIIKVPRLLKKDPKDWRKADVDGPSGARRDLEPAPEGAWGSTAVRGVSQEAMAEVITPKRAPVTRAQKIRWLSLLAGSALVVGLVGWFAYGYWQKRQQIKAFDKALEQLKADDDKIGPEAKAAFHTAAGNFRFHDESDKGTAEAVEHFRLARKDLESAKEGPERDTLLAELASAWVELGGDAAEVTSGVHVSWEDVGRDIQRTLGRVGAPEARAEAFRQICRKLIGKNQVDQMRTLALQLAPAETKLDPKNGNAIITIPDEAPELLAVAALELLRAGQTDRAMALANEAVAMYAKGKSAHPLAISATLVGVCIALDLQAPDKAVRADDDKNLQIGHALGLALRGQPDLARQSLFAEVPDDKKVSPMAQWKALVTIAGAQEKPDASVLADAVTLIETTPLSDLSPTVLLRMVELAEIAGGDEARLQRIADAQADVNLSGRMSLIILRAKLARTKDKADLAWADAVNKNSAAHGVAMFDIARHNTRRGAFSLSDVENGDAANRAFGFLAVALGGKDAE